MDHASLTSLIEAVFERPTHYLTQLAITLVLGTTAFVTGRAIYNIFFHPLRKFPGPLIARATNYYRIDKALAGRMPQAVKALHDKYGPVVRIAPFELAFIDSQAWKDIYGRHGPNEMAKDDRFYRPMGKRMADNIVTADRQRHGMLRRQLAHGFSERSMRAQEPIFRQYVGLLIQRLAERSDTGEPVDMRAWFNFTTFDVIGNLGFGSDFGCLDKSEYHPWVEAITTGIRDSGLMKVLLLFVSPTIVYLLNKLGLFKGRKGHMSNATSRLRSRMEMETERPDFIQGLLKKGDALSQGELEANAAVIVLAGSETTATLLCGTLYLLGTHRDILDKVVREVRSAFKSEDDIDLLSVNGLNYMLACLDESLRHYPPIATGLPRIVPKGGCTIAGHWVPQNTTVAVWQLAANYSSRNFTKPDEFHPERFLGDPRFAQDDLNALQPFSVGTRNCIGRTLAYAEMRLILARILFRFDIELAPEAGDWIKRQRTYSMWDKPPLPFYLKAAAGTA